MQIMPECVPQRPDTAPQPSPYGSLEWATTATQSRLSRAVSAGTALRLAPGVYVSGASVGLEHVARHHLFPIVAKYWPRAVLCGKSAASGGLPVDGELYVSLPEPPRRSPLILPGVKVIAFAGPGELPGDIQMPHGLWMSGAARCLVENVYLRGRQARFRAGLEVVDDKIDDIARAGGAGRVRNVLEQLDAIKDCFDSDAIDIVRRRLVAVLGTVAAGERRPNDRLAARLAGLPYDAQRIMMLSKLVEHVSDRPPVPRPALSPESRWEWLSFFESYFSNFIEGTEFGVDEARRIALEGHDVASRPQDAHDVDATFRLATDPLDRIRTPKSGEDLVDTLVQRHSVLMAARPDKRPGQMKEKANFAGGYQFVEPELVKGTLIKGYDTFAAVRDPLARATCVMALVTECHPFDDGNGRVARLAANAELSAAGEVRIVIPTVYRNHYLAALTGFSNGAGRGEQLMAVLEFAQRWTASIDWSSYEGACVVLEECNAFLDSGVAEATGRRLTMPRRVDGIAR